MIEQRWLMLVVLFVARTSFGYQFQSVASSAALIEAELHVGYAAIGTLIGGSLQLAVQLPALRRVGYVFHPDFSWRDAGVRQVLRLMGPSVIAASTTQFNVLINSMFASTLGDGPIFWLSIAFRLMQLPLGLFGVALGTVTLPLLAPGQEWVDGHMS